MKKIIVAVSLLLPAFLNAQSFEGVIKYSMEYKGDQAAMLQKTAPSANVITVKGKNAKVVMEGGIYGAMIGDIINIGDENTTYFVQASQKTAYKVKSDEVKDDDKSEDATVTKESGTATILGYKCQKYKVVTKQGTNYVWATKEIDANMAEFKGKVVYKGVEGMVMKQEMNMTEQGMTYTVVMTMVSFDKKSVSDKEFQIPTDYTIKEELPAILQMQQGR